MAPVAHAVGIGDAAHFASHSDGAEVVVAAARRVTPGAFVVHEGEGDHFVLATFHVAHFAFTAQAFCLGSAQGTDTHALHFGEDVVLVALEFRCLVQVADLVYVSIGNVRHVRHASRYFILVASDLVYLVLCGQLVER